MTYEIQTLLNFRGFSIQVMTNLPGDILMIQRNLAGHFLITIFKPIITIFNQLYLSAHPGER
jgi:hypothetical protein